MTSRNLVALVAAATLGVTLSACGTSPSPEASPSAGAPGPLTAPASSEPLEGSKVEVDLSKRDQRAASRASVREDIRQGEVALVKKRAAEKAAKLKAAREAEAKKEAAKRAAAAKKAEALRASKAAKAQARGNKESNLSQATGNVCTASYYHEPQMTATGETFNPRAMTAASKTLPLNSYIKVSNPKTGATVKVRINDRGPYVGGRCLDLSEAAFEAIGNTNSGVMTVAWERVR